MPTLFAQPYNPDSKGFYFSNQEEFDTKSTGLTDSYGGIVEEFEISVIDGKTEECAILNACGLDQMNFGTALEALEQLDEYQLTALYYLLDGGSNLDEALAHIEDVQISECRLLEAASELFDECHLHYIPSNLHAYIDYAAFARDMDQGGSMREFEFAGKTYTCTNADSIF